MVGGYHSQTCSCPRCGYTGQMVTYGYNGYNTYGTQSTLSYGGYASNTGLYFAPPLPRGVFDNKPKRPAASRPHNHVPVLLELRRIIEIEEEMPEPRIPTARRAGCRARGRRPIRSLPGCRR